MITFLKNYRSVSVSLMAITIILCNSFISHGKTAVPVFLLSGQSNMAVTLEGLMNFRMTKEVMLTMLKYIWMVMVIIQKE